MDVNKVTLIGRLTSTPECGMAASGQRTATFTLTTTYSWKTERETRANVSSQHRVHVWGKLAEIVEAHLNRGARVYVEGRLVPNATGDVAEIVGDEIILLGPKK